MRATRRKRHLRPTLHHSIAAMLDLTAPTRQLFSFILCLILAPGMGSPSLGAEPIEPELQTRLYVVTPGIRNLLYYGGAGVLVFDADHEYAFVKRIATPASRAAKP